LPVLSYTEDGKDVEDKDLSNKTVVFKQNYKVRFGMVPVGYITVTLYEDRDLYAVSVKANTTGIADVVYPVRDKFLTFFKKDLTSFLKASISIREGSYSRDEFMELKDGKLACRSGEKVIERDVGNKRIFDMVSAHFAFVLGMRKWRDYGEASNFYVSDCKKDIRPEVDYYGTSTIKKGDKEIRVSQYALFLPVKGILLARSEDKKVYILLDEKDMWLVYSYIPTQWGNIHIEAE
ncbi:MAG: DUF3108 domain-containing protein, partial [Thermosulfidibacteraceae bacterium]